MTEQLAPDILRMMLKTAEQALESARAETLQECRDDAQYCLDEMRGVAEVIHSLDRKIRTTQAGRTG